MKFASLVLLSAVSLSACAQAPAPTTDATPSGAPAGTPPPTASAAAPAPGTPDERARAAVLKLSPQARIDHIGPAPLPGFREVVVAGQVIYITDDGRHLLQGSLFDMEAREDLGQSRMSAVRRELLKSVPAADRIIFAPPNPVHTVSVFTDVECGYCRRLHAEIGEYNRQGIAIEYLAFPRMGPASEDFRKMVSVWCAKDRKQALTLAKAGKSVSSNACQSPVAQHYDLGQRVGLNGTPMIITAAGQAMPGYMPPAELRAALDKLAAEAGAPPGPATAGSTAGSSR